MLQPRKLIPNLLDKKTNYEFNLGGVLSRMLKEKWFGSHTTFSDLVEKDFGMVYRKANYVINIYEAVVKSGVSDEQFAGLGWCKLREITRVIDTPENVDKWIAAAHEHTVEELRKLVKADKAKSGSTADTHANNTQRSIYNFHDDQAEIVDKALKK
jgi:hypothetical protein